MEILLLTKNRYGGGREMGNLFGRVLLINSVSDVWSSWSKLKLSPYKMYGPHSKYHQKLS